jgi:hypothetical protein
LSSVTPDKGPCPAVLLNLQSVPESGWSPERPPDTLWPPGSPPMPPPGSRLARAHQAWTPGPARQPMDLLVAKVQPPPRSRIRCSPDGIQRPSQTCA